MRCSSCTILVSLRRKTRQSPKWRWSTGADYLLKNRWDAYLLPKVLRSMIERAANAEALFDEKRGRRSRSFHCDAVMTADCNGNVTFLNLAAERLTGWSCEDAAAAPWRKYFNSSTV